MALVPDHEYFYKTEHQKIVTDKKDERNFTTSSTTKEWSENSILINERLKIKEHCDYENYEDSGYISGILNMLKTSLDNCKSFSVRVKRPEELC